MKKNILTAIIIGMIITTGIATASAFNGSRHTEKPESEVLTQIREAVENNDFSTWEKLHKDNNLTGPFIEKINEENFDLLKDFHQARVAGNKERGKEIVEKLGIEKGPLLRQERKELRERKELQMRKMEQKLVRAGMQK